MSNPKIRNTFTKVKVKVMTPEGVDEVVVSEAAPASPNLCSLRSFRLRFASVGGAAFRR